MNARSIVSRLRTAFGVCTNLALAKSLGLPVGTINSWLRRGSIPADHLLSIAERRQLSLDWLVHGVHPSFEVYAPREAAIRAALDALLAAVGPTSPVKARLMPSAPEVLDRLKLAYQVKNDSQLARVLGLAQTTVSNWRRLGPVPYEVCARAAADGWASLDFLLFGDGP